MSSPSSHVAPDAGKTGQLTRRLDRHDEAVLAAEVRRLVTELHTSGPLATTTLVRRCHTNHWREGTLDAAIREGTRQRRLPQLPFGYVDVPRDEPGMRDRK